MYNEKQDSNGVDEMELNKQFLGAGKCKKY